MSRQLILPKENWIKIGVQRFEELFQGSNAKSIPAKVIQIAPTELELLTDVSFLKEEPCILRIPRPSGGMIRITGEFKSSRRERSYQDLWISSCRISTDFPQAFLDEMATLGLMDRRKHYRYLVCETVTAYHQKSGKQFVATVTEISESGIRVFAESARTVGDELELIFDENPTSIHQLDVRVVRIMRVDRGYELGCEIITGSIDPIIDECHLTIS